MTPRNPGGEAQTAKTATPGLACIISRKWLKCGFAPQI